MGGGALKIEGTSAYVVVGPQNSGFVHFETNATLGYWFDKRLWVDGGELGSYQGSNLHLMAGFTEGITVLESSGNVGIGTTGPTGHLQIDGNISASAWTTDGISFDSNAATYTDTSTAAAGTVAVRTANSFGAPTFASTNAITVTDAFTLYVPKPIAGTNTTITRANSAYFEGNVGIGTTTPAATLHVSGNGYFSGLMGIGIAVGAPVLSIQQPSDSNGIRITETGGTAGLNANLEIVNGATTPYLNIRVQDNSNYRNIVLAKDGGNVGIGTAGPLTPLHIG